MAPPAAADGREHSCESCGRDILADRLKLAVHIEIAILEDLLHDLRAGNIADVTLPDGVDVEDATPWDFSFTYVGPRGDRR
jgi:hypothetical protein